MLGCPKERKAEPMVTQESADLSLQRIALTALLYYPDITVDDPTYQLEAEVEWCLQELEPADRDLLRELVERTITDPTGHRAELFTRLMDLTPAES